MRITSALLLLIFQPGLFAGGKQSLRFKTYNHSPHITTSLESWRMTEHSFQHKDHYTVITPVQSSQWITSSFKFVQWAPKDTSSSQQSAFWPFKVIQGRCFWYLSYSEDRTIVAWVVLFDTVPACDRQTDRRIYYSWCSALHSKLCWRTVKTYV